MNAYTSIADQLKLPTGIFIDGKYQPAASGKTFETKKLIIFAVIVKTVSIFLFSSAILEQRQHYIVIILLYFDYICICIAIC